MTADSGGVRGAAKKTTARGLRAIIESSSDAIIGKDINGIVQSWNDGAERLFGYTAEEMIGRSITVIMPPNRQAEETEILSRICRGELVDHFDTVRQRKDGSLVDISLTISPIRDAEGRIIGASKIARDITERKRQSEHIQFLLREMAHRTNNLLSVIQAMAQQTARSSDNYEDFTARFIARLQGLSTCNQLLIQQDWKGAALDELVRLQLQPFVESNLDRLRIIGTPIMLLPEATQSIGLALHELATNASKHGALSNERGRVCVSWEVFGDAADRRFRMVWQESDGPAVTEPRRKGFGSIVLEQITRTSLACDTEMEFSVRGLCWTLNCPANTVLTDAMR